MDLFEIARREAEAQGVDPNLVLKILRAESGGRSGLVSSKGAVGPMQLMPGTARELGVDPTNDEQNIRGGVRYLKQQLDRFGNPALAAAAYNAGPGAVAKAGGVPNFPETQAYVQKVAGMQDDSDIFSPVKQSSPAKTQAAQGDDSDIFAPIKTAPVIPPAPAKQPEAPGVWDTIKKSADYSLNKLADGIIQAIGAHPDNLDAQKGAVARGLAEMRKQEDAAQAKLRTQRPFAAGVGESVPAALTASIPGLGILGSAAAGALPSLASYGSPQERATAGAVDFGAGLGANFLAKGLSSLFKPAATQIPQDVAQAAERIGYPMTMGQRTLNPSIQKAEDMLSQSIGGSGVFANTARKGQEAVNRAISEQIGIPGTSKIGQAEVTLADTLANTERNSLIQNAQVSPVHVDVLSAWAKAEKKLLVQPDAARNTVDSNPVVQNVRDWIKQGAPLDGEQYQALRTAVREATANADNSKAVGSSALERYLGEFKKGLDKAAQGADSKAWRSSDVKYSTLDMLEKPGVWNPATGDVSPKMFSNAFIRKYGDQALTGALPGQAQDVMMVAKGIPGYPTGSQTAGRLASGSIRGYAAAPFTYTASKVLNSPMLGEIAASGLLSGNPLLQRAVRGAAMYGGRAGGLGLGYGGLLNAYPELLGQ